jgi:hypothetical protein
MTHDARIIRVVRRMKAEGATNAEVAMSIGSTVNGVKGMCNQRGIKRGQLTGLPFQISGRLMGKVAGLFPFRFLKCAIMQRLKALRGHSFAVSGKTMLCKGS